MPLLDNFATVSGIVSLPISVGIFLYQQHISSQQKHIIEEQSRLSRDLGELELREKLGPIQVRARELRTSAWRFKNCSVELTSALIMLKRIHGIEQRLSISDGVQEAVVKIQSDDDIAFLQQVRGLQHKTALRSEFEILDSCIEEIQKETTDPESPLQIQGDKCQNQIRLLIETADRLGQESVYLLTDTRAVEAVYSHATDSTKQELAELLWSFWRDPLGRLPAPVEYGCGRFKDKSLAETLAQESEQIGKSIENLVIGK